VRIRDSVGVLPLLLLALALPLLALACDGDGGSTGGTASPSSGSPVASASPSPGTVDIGGTAVPISTAVVTGRLPDGFPEDFPIFSEAEILRAAFTGERFLVGMTTDTPRADVLAFYEGALAETRWQVGSKDETSLPDTTFLIFKVAETSGQGSVGVAELEGKTNIVLSVPPD